MVVVQRNLDNYNKPLYIKVICITSGNLHPTAPVMVHVKHMEKNLNTTKLL